MSPRCSRCDAYEQGDVRWGWLHDRRFWHYLGGIYRSLLVRAHFPWDCWRNKEESNIWNDNEPYDNSLAAGRRPRRYPNEDCVHSLLLPWSGVMVPVVCGAGWTHEELLRMQAADARELGWEAPIPEETAFARIALSIGTEEER